MCIWGWALPFTGARTNLAGVLAQSLDHALPRAFTKGQHAPIQPVAQPLDDFLQR